MKWNINVRTYKQNHLPGIISITLKACLVNFHCMDSWSIKCFRKIYKYRWTVDKYQLQVFEGVEVVDLECAATANPYPTYKWYRGSDFINKTEVTSTFDNRYTITGGKFTIEGAESTKDLNTYHCKAENEIGSVLSNQAKILFGCTFLN